MLHLTLRDFLRLYDANEVSVLIWDLKIYVRLEFAADVLQLPIVPVAFPKKD